MKKTSITLFLIFAIILSSGIFGQNFKIPKDHPKYEKLQFNLLKALESDNEGLKFSSAYALGEMKSSAAIDLLTRMLRSHKDENYRIMAALSLTKIGTEQALFMVKRVGKFTDNKKLAAFCEKFHKIKTYPIPEEDRALAATLFK